jgi:hypothetical protein
LWGRRTFFRVPEKSLLSGNSALFVDRFYATPVAKFLEFDLAFNCLLVFADIIITPLADSAAQRDQFVSSFNFGHKGYSSITFAKRQ